MILAVDPGLAKCGYAIVQPRTAAIVELGVIASGRNATRGVSADRIRRARAQADKLAELVERHRCTAAIGEAVTLGGSLHVKLAMSIGLHLSWGVLTAVARERGLELYEVAPKVWQHAVQPGRKKINYGELELAMAAYVGPQVGVQLACIAKGDRNHALDACGIGMLLALRPHQATRIEARRWRRNRNADQARAGEAGTV